MARSAKEINIATLYIAEYADVRGSTPVEPALATQPVTVGGTSTQSAAFNANTRFVRLHTDAACFVLFGANPTAVTGASPRLAAGATEYFHVDRGLDPTKLKVAVIS